MGKDAEFLGAGFGCWITAEGTLLLEDVIVSRLELETDKIVVSDCLSVPLSLRSHNQHVLSTKAGIVVVISIGDTHFGERADSRFLIAEEEGTRPITLQDNGIPYSHDATASSGSAGDDLVKVEDIVGALTHIALSEVFPKALVDLTLLVRTTQP